MIAIVKQNSGLGQIVRFRFKVIDVVCEHFNQTLVVGDTSFCTVSKERESQYVYGEMSLDTIRAFIEPIWDLLGDRVESTEIVEFEQVRANYEVFKRSDRSGVGNNWAIVATEEENQTLGMDKAATFEWNILSTQEWL